MSAAESIPADGRRARRDRNRAAVIDAVLELLAEGEPMPATEAIAERAGVSVSSVFRYFDGLDDLHRQTIERHAERFGHLFELPGLGDGTRDERITRLVDARLALHEAVAPIARAARSQVREGHPIGDQLAEIRRRMRSQVRAHFAEELAPMPRAVADDVVDAIDALTSFEAWDLLRRGAGRSQARVGRTWQVAVAALLGGD